MRVSSDDHMCIKDTSVSYCINSHFCCFHIELLQLVDYRKLKQKTKAKNISRFQLLKCVNLMLFLCL